ncbi:MAG: DMT family transporter [Bdellovibrio sp.]|nr:DMT family transporter [Bdellovibrio sp.]
MFKFSFDQRSVGILQVIAAGICFGFLGLFGKNAYAQGASPLELLGLRFITSGLLLQAILSLIYGPRFLKLSWKNFFICNLLGIFGYALFSSFYFFAIKGLSISLAVLLLYTFPIWVALGARMFFGDKIPKGRKFTIPLSMVGITFLVWGEFSIGHYYSFACGLGSAIFYAIYILISSRSLSKINPLISVSYIQLSAGVILCVLGLESYSRAVMVYKNIWPIILGMAIICSIGAMTLFQSGLQKLKSWEASILSTSEPLMGISLAVLFLGEKLSLIQVIGGVLVIAAFIFISLPASYSLSGLSKNDKTL